MTELSIVIPALNEERHLQESLPRLRDFFKNRAGPYEILIVDDGSRDGTCRVVEEFARRDSAVRLLRHDRNYGKGWAIRTGMLAAQGTWVVFMDADLAYDLEDTTYVVGQLKQGYDLAIGSRSLVSSRLVSPPSWRPRIANRALNRLVRGLFALDARDNQCELDGFPKARAQPLLGIQKFHSIAHRWVCF